MPIPPHLIDVLKDHLARYAEPGPDGLVFVGPKGAPVNASNFTAGAWKGARQVVGMSRLHFHDLRHFTAEFLAAHGATEVDIMAWLGQSTPDMARLYQWATADRAATLARLMSETVENSRVMQLPTAKAEPS